MGRPKNYGSHNLSIFPVGPVALDREIVSQSQIDRKDNTIIWGVNNDLPLRILAAINASPTTTSCLDKIERFLQGAKFSDEGLMTMPIDSEGTTLWQFHQALCHSFSRLHGFAPRFTFNNAGKILQALPMDIESLRFIRPDNPKSKKISEVIHNPYIGVKADYRVENSTCYSLWDPINLKNEIYQKGDSFTGQIYYYGVVRKPYKFYPVPDFWSGEQWIYVDAGIQTYHKSNIDNGFFISVLLKMIGDPNQPSKNPKYRTETIGTDGVKREGKPSKTVGEEFNEMMSHTFSGAKKAGSVMAWWSQNKDNSPDLQAFPNNTNFDIVSGTLNDAIRGITIATGVPAILANLSQQEKSLGSDGNAMQKSIELMQSRVAPDQQMLENFYNKILLPNLAKPVTQQVKIVNYNPVSVIPEIPDYLWQWMDDQEKTSFVQSNYPSITINPNRSINQQDNTIASQTDQQTSDVMKNLTGKQSQNLRRIIRQYDRGELTYEQAADSLRSGFGMTDQQVITWIGTKDEQV